MTRRHRALRIVAWLLTPVVVWAAAFLATTGAAAMGGVAGGVAVPLAAGLLGGGITLGIWVLLLRRWKRDVARDHPNSATDLSGELGAGE